MKKLLSFLAIVLISAIAFAQSVTITFTTNDAANQYEQLNRVVIANLTKGWQETIYWPDTTLTMQNGTGIGDVETFHETSLQLSQNNPNPFTGTTEVSLMVAEDDEVMLDIMDINGKTAGTHRMRPQAGTHKFRITLATAGTYVMTARQNGQVSSIKMVCNGGGDGNRIEYMGNGGDASHASANQQINGPKYTINNPFDLGDQMEYVGYATINGTEVESEHIIQSLNVSQTIFLYFALDGQPCPGIPTMIDIDSNIYNTVQIGNQCWMKENLRTTCYSNGTSIPLVASTSASTITPYRYNPNNDASIVPTYGYLYNWAAVMHGASSSSANPSGVQGICPNGWHVPSYAEWTQLSDYVGSLPQYQCDNNSNYIAKALASTTGWDSSTETCGVGNNPGTNNATGFSALPAGYLYYIAYGNTALFWSATECDGSSVYFCAIHSYFATVGGSNYIKNGGTSVRCLRDANSSVSLPMVTTNTVSSITTTSAICGGNVISDGGDMITDRGVCWSTSQNPTVSDSHISSGSGTGSFTGSMMGLSPNTTYYVRAYATNSEGTAYGNQLSFTTSSDGIDGQPCLGAAMVIDIDGNTYNTVQIGNQCWMKENLRTTHFANGANIPMGSTESYNAPYRYAPDNNNSNVSTYGYLYNWPAVMYGTSSSNANPSGVQGICPNGWHVPSDSEWTQLTYYVGSHMQYQCNNSSDNIAKALASTTGWNTSSNACAVGNNPSANNTTGFSVLPAGIYPNYYGLFGYSTFFWSTTEEGVYNAYYRYLSYKYADVSMNRREKSCGFSVRCLRNATGSVSLPTVTTNAMSSVITTTSATCGGNVTLDGGATVTARGVCWSTSPNPIVSDNHTSDGSGMGSFTSSMTGLALDTTYYVRAYATNNQGTAYGNELSFTTVNPAGDGQPCPGAATVTDIDGNSYNTVKIGNQCWMKENLRTTSYANGVSIPMGSTDSSTDPYRYAPNGNNSNVSTYGYLYNWPAVMHGASSSASNPSGVQGICPTGWHVPSDAEWTQLTNYVGSQTQYQCNNSSSNIAKALASTTGWNSSSYTCSVGNNPSINNAIGFSALPAGDYHYGNYSYFGYDASFWCATIDYGNNAYERNLECYGAYVFRNIDDRYFGKSVRCLRD
jgi:uncharacterized protein (TIGR02145 family)